MYNFFYIIVKKRKDFPDNPINTRLLLCKDSLEHGQRFCNKQKFTRVIKDYLLTVTRKYKD